MDGITVESVEPPRDHHAVSENTGNIIQGWLRAPVDWDQTALENEWGHHHGWSRLGIGLCVANSPRRRFIVSGVPDDLEWVRRELERVIAALPGREVQDRDATPAGHEVVAQAAGRQA